MSKNGCQSQKITPRNSSLEGNFNDKKYTFNLTPYYFTDPLSIYSQSFCTAFAR